MARLAIGVGLLAVGASAVFSYAVADWYRFTTTSEISPTDGVRGNSHLLVWENLNALMPAVAQAWGCKTLIDRQGQAMAGGQAAPPSTCQLHYDFDTPRADVAFIEAQANAAVLLAGRQSSASDGQLRQLQRCMVETLPMALTRNQREELRLSPSSDALRSANVAAASVASECQAKAGITG